ncbi:MAG TPA: N-6 DNA methylase [Streptosporangiaceae bacterium]|nr:N-6 DNA methylase [Streptosporangiaceae bacterium]
MPELASLTAADIARLAGVTRATVSNWRRRHADFPEPTGGTDASPAYDRAEVEAWLAARGALPELPPGERLWRAVLDEAVGAELGEVVTSAALALSGQAKGTRPAVASAAADAAAASGREETLALLIERYAEAAGVSVTPAPVARLMAALADPGEGVVLDPASGTGEILAAVLDRGAARACAQELDVAMARLAEIRLRSGRWRAKADVRDGDSLRADAYRGLEADAVLCHPPFASRDWPQEELAADPRWDYGIPPKAEPELAWVQHALAHLRPGGRAVLLLPPAVASRPSGRRIRTELLRRGALRAVASLPAGAARPSHIPLQVWVLERPASTGPSDPLILLADLAELLPAAGKGARAQTGWQQVQDIILEAWRSFSGGAAEAASSEAGEDCTGTWRIMRVIDLLDEAVDLSPTRHVGAGGSRKSPSQTSETVKLLRTRMRTALAALEERVPGVGWLPREDAANWRTATIAELARSGLVLLHRAQGPAAPNAGLPAGPHPADVCPVLTLGDVKAGSAPSGAVPQDAVQEGWVKISAGDVVIPAGLDELTRALVATGEHDGAILGEGLHLIRPDLARMDPWFLGGVLSARHNARQASYGTTSIRIDARRLAVPRLPVSEQRLYGEAFRDVSGFGTAIRDLARVSDELAELLGTSLANGTLMPTKRD